MPASTPECGHCSTSTITMRGQVLGTRGKAWDDPAASPLPRRSLVTYPNEDRADCLMPGLRGQAGPSRAALGAGGQSFRASDQCEQPTVFTYCRGDSLYSFTASGLLSTRSNTHRPLT
jgi:hypothetical protein